MTIKNIVAIFMALNVAGCVVPMTPAEFREAVKKEGSYTDSFTVNRPYTEVTRTMKRMSDECLNFSMSMGNSKKPWGYANTTFNASPKQAELRFQRKIPDQIGTIPEKGMYYLVADMTAMGAAKTQVDVYYWDDVEVAAKAIKGWATGDMLGCPDPAEMF